MQFRIEVSTPDDNLVVVVYAQARTLAQAKQKVLGCLKLTGVETVRWPEGAIKLV